jgi:hypothetical protein
MAPRRRVKPLPKNTTVDEIVDDYLRTSIRWTFGSDTLPFEDEALRIVKAMFLGDVEDYVLKELDYRPHYKPPSTGPQEEHLMRILSGLTNLYDAPPSGASDVKSRPVQPEPMGDHPSKREGYD